MLWIRLFYRAFLDAIIPGPEVLKPSSVLRISWHNVAFTASNHEIKLIRLEHETFTFLCQLKSLWQRQVHETRNTQWCKIIAHLHMCRFIYLRFKEERHPDVVIRVLPMCIRNSWICGETQHWQTLLLWH